MTASAASLALHAVPHVPSIRAGDDLAAVLIAALERAQLGPRDHDVLVVSHKVVSKAEDRYVALCSVRPSRRAEAIASRTGKDPRLVQVILSESARVLRERDGLLICEHRLGMVMANAGVDHSNVGALDARVLRLPEDPDASSARLLAALEQRFSVRMAVIVCDSAGRAWRNGVVGLAIGAAGLPSLLDFRGRRDLDGRELRVTQVGLADQVACAAELLMGEADEGRPAVLVRGLVWSASPSPARALLRPRDQDLFR